MDLSTLLKYSRKNIKLIIVVVLCCSLLAGVIKSISDYSSYSKEKNNEAALQSQMETLNNQKTAVQSQIDMLKEDETYKLVKDINSSELFRYTAVYYIDKNVSLYNTAANDTNVLQKVLADNKIDMPSDIVDIFIDFTESSGNKTLTISVYGKDQEQLLSFRNIAEQCFEEAKTTIRTKVGASIIFLLSENEIISSNAALSSLQKKYSDQYSALSASINDINTKTSEIQTTLSSISYSFFSKEVLEYTLLGLILGIFLAYVFILSRFYLSSKLIGIEQLNPKVSLLASSNDIKKALTASVVPVIYSCGKTKDPIGVVSSENLAFTKDVYSYLQRNTDYNLRYLDNIFGSADIAKAFLECKGIIIVEKYKTSHIKKIERIIDICKSNSVTIYGAIIIE